MNVYFFVFGSSIASVPVGLLHREQLGGRMIRALLTEARDFRASTAAASQTRPWRSNIALWLLTWVSQIVSSPQ